MTEIRAALDKAARRLHDASGANTTFEDCPHEWCVEARAVLATPATAHEGHR